MINISDQRVEAALSAIAESDLQVAHWRAQVLRTEFMAKAAEALVYKTLDGSIEDKKQSVRLAPEVKTAWESHFLAVVEHEKLKAVRERQYMVIELYRTAEASKRRGNA